MRICRFTLNDDPAAGPRLGVLGEDGIRDVTAVADSLPVIRWPVPPGDQLIANLERLRPQIEALSAKAPVIARADVELLSPVANPGKMICGVGNWSHHGAPLGMLGFLFKVTSAIVGEGAGVEIRWPDRVTLHEPELAIVIGRECTNVAEGEALDYVAGYSAALDTTMKEEKEFFGFCKSFDTFGTLGPCLVTADEIPEPSGLGYTFHIDGALRGERSFRDLTGSPAQLVAFASSMMTLYPGDLILSGAADVGPIHPGEKMRIEIPGIGEMNVTVKLSPIARMIA